MSKYLYIYFVFPILLSAPAVLPLLQVLIPFGNKRFVDARPAGRFSPEVLSMKWFRWYHGTVDDRKWLVVSRHCGQSRAVVLAVWCALLEFASQAEERGSIAAFDCESLDALLGVEDGVCAAVMQAFVRKGLVSGGRLTAWDKRQPRREDEDAVDRQRRRRQRLVLPPAQVASPDAPTDSGTDDDAISCSVIPAEYEECHAVSRTVTQRHAPEEDKEKIRHSSPPSPPSSPASPADAALLPRVDAACQDRVPPSAEEGDMGFQQLVAAYPAGHVAPRAEALDIWQRLGRGNARPGLPRLLQGLALWRDSSLWRKEDGRYIPKLANFLRRRMWEDVPPASGEDWKAAEARQKAYRARMNALLQESCHG